MPFQLSPSLTARYFFHQCERFLRYRAGGAGAPGIPALDEDHGPVMQALRDQGYEWDREVVRDRLAGRVEVAPVRDDPRPGPALLHLGLDGRAAPLDAGWAGHLVYTTKVLRLAPNCRRHRSAMRSLRKLSHPSPQLMRS
jgi:hypothetical protein